MQTPLIREKLTLRLPRELHESMRVVAVENGRSLNAEIVQRLSRSFDGGVDQITRTVAIDTYAATTSRRRNERDFSAP